MNKILSQVTTVAGAALIYGCSDRYIRQLCKEGKLVAAQDHKGNWIILKSSIQTKEETKMKFEIGSLVNVENSKGKSNGIIKYFQEYGTLKMYGVQLPHGYIQDYHEDQIKLST